MEAFASWRQLIKALADWFRTALASCSSRPAGTDQTMPDSGKLLQRPFRKNSICTQMKAAEWSCLHLLWASPFFSLPFNALRPEPCRRYSIWSQPRQRSCIVIEQARPQPTHLRVNYLLLCPMSLLTVFLSFSQYETRKRPLGPKKKKKKITR